MPNPTVPRAGKRCANPACGQWFRSRRRPTTARFCSRQCAADCRPRAARVAAGRKGGRASGVKRRAMSLAEIRRRVERLSTIDAFLLGRKYGKADMGNQRTTAYRIGFSAGFEKGFDAAMKDLIRRSA